MQMLCMYTNVQVIYLMTDNNHSDTFKYDELQWGSIIDVVMYYDFLKHANI